MGKQLTKTNGKGNGTAAEGAPGTALATREAASLVPEKYREFVQEDYEVIQTGGQSKWIDLDKMKAGDSIVGILQGMQTIEDGDDLRYFFNIALTEPCPVTFKGEDGAKKDEIAQPGDVVALGERSKLEFMRGLCEDGGLYGLKIRLHSKIALKGGRTMWTFDIGKRTIRPALRMRAEFIPAAKTPF